MLNSKFKNRTELEPVSDLTLRLAPRPQEDGSRKLIRPPEHLTDRELHRSPRSSSDRKRIERACLEAQSRFNLSRRIQDKGLDDLFPGIAESSALIKDALRAPGKTGNVQPHELIVLATICKHLRPEVVFEFGTYDGLTALHFAKNSPPTARIFTIDLDPADPRRRQNNDDTYYIADSSVGLMFRDTEEASKIEQLYGDTMTFPHDQFKGQADLIFIDAGHEYEMVRSDTEKALEMLAPGGAILWHDFVFTHYGVYTWLNELSDSLPLFSIPNTTLVCYRASLPEDQTLVDRLELQMLKRNLDEWSSFRRSPSYRIALKLRRFREFLIPSGSRRERLSQRLRS